MADRSPDPHISAGGMIGVIWMETVLAFVAVAFRTWIKITAPRSPQSRRFGFDDLWVLFAFLCFLGMSACHSVSIPIMYMLYEVVDGHKPPTADFVPEVTKFLYLEFVLIILFWTNIWAVKAAFLAFYRGLFANVHGWQRMAWWFVVVLCALSYVGNWALQFEACTPLKNYFVLGGCQTQRDIYVSNVSLYYSTVVDTVCDVLIMLLPLSILFDLTLSRRKKVALGGLFSAGAVIIAFAILRLVLTLPGHDRHVNPKWLALMSSTESGIAVIVSCAPPFKVFLTRRKNSANARQASSPFGSGSNTRITDDKVASRGNSLKTVESGEEMLVPRVRDSGHESSDDMLSHRGMVAHLV